jgi:uncharacterized OsmC-like protein
MFATQKNVLGAKGKLQFLYTASPKSARVAYSATTVDRDPADPFRATVFAGAGNAAVVPVAVELALGGHGDSPSSVDLLCAALAASLDSSIRMAANAADIALKALSVDVRGWVDVRGALAIDSDVPVAVQTLTCTVRIEPSAEVDSEHMRRMLVAAEGASIVLATLRRAVPCHIRIEEAHRAEAQPLARAA